MQKQLKATPSPFDGARPAALIDSSGLWWLSLIGQRSPFRSIWCLDVLGRLSIALNRPPVRWRRQFQVGVVGRSAGVGHSAPTPTAWPVGRRVKWLRSVASVCELGRATSRVAFEAAEWETFSQSSPLVSRIRLCVRPWTSR